MLLAGLVSEEVLEPVEVGEIDAGDFEGGFTVVAVARVGEPFEPVAAD